jgi:RNA polymerase-binding transcription factor DksA
MASWAASRAPEHRNNFTNMIQKQLLEELNGKLLKEKEEIEAGLKDFAKADPKLKGDFDTQFPDIAGQTPEESESADEVEEYENKLHVEHVLELRLRDVNKALEKIRKGSYGICENCGKEIPFERLQANPAAKNCATHN